MKKIFITLTVNILFFLFPFIGKGQENTSADSLQRIIMKDSLALSDSVIDRIFIARTHFITESARITADNRLTENEKETAMTNLVSETNNYILAQMGTVKFQSYTAMIRRRIASRTVGSTTPLASGGN